MADPYSVWFCGECGQEYKAKVTAAACCICVNCGTVEMYIEEYCNKCKKEEDNANNDTTEA